jgi:flagellar basal body-associated protein FliL
MPEAVRIPARNKGRAITGMITGTIAVLVAAGVAGTYLWSNSARRASPSGSMSFTLPLETFVVNLNGTERGYLRVGIALGLARGPERKEEIPVALVRDTILSVLSAVQAGQLLPPEGKNKLKNDILQALKNRVPQLAVEDVYFTEFLVQT